MVDVDRILLDSNVAKGADYCLYLTRNMLKPDLDFR